MERSSQLAVFVLKQIKKAERKKSIVLDYTVPVGSLSNVEIENE
jgi:hypothetical protein